MATIEDDPRIDPRLKKLFGSHVVPEERSVASREQLLAEASSPEGLALRERASKVLDAMDDETIAPKEGLDFSTVEIPSEPDGNTILLRVIRPHTEAVLPCVYVIHGGGMARSSCFDGVFRMWGRLLAHQGVAVVMVEFRNAVVPSSVAEVAPFPGGLNDCVSGVKWVHAHSDELRIDPSRIVVAGESGGGNLTLAVGMKLKRDGDLGLVSGLYSMCPYIAGEYPQDRLPSTIENNGIVINVYGNRGRVGYGIEAFEARDPLAWPLFATEDDVAGLPPTVISVNECDPLRDEGIEFYRLLIRAGVAARCRQNMGAVHGTELLAIACPDISRETAASIAQFTHGTSS
jgi:acetyl esterase